MKTKKWNSTGFYKVLDTFQGTAEEYAVLKTKYWAEYKRIWKQEKRKREHSFTVFFTNAELKIINSKAGVLGISRTKYIKQAALHDFIFPNMLILMSLLTKNHIAISNLLQMDIDNPIAKLAYLRMQQLEQDILSNLSHPKIATNDH